MAMQITYQEGYRIRTKELRVGDDLPPILWSSQRVTFHASGVELKLLQSAVEGAMKMANLSVGKVAFEEVFPTRKAK
jgi:hypothetical protein